MGYSKHSDHLFETDQTSVLHTRPDDLLSNYLLCLFFFLRVISLFSHPPTRLRSVHIFCLGQGKTLDNSPN